MTNKRFNKLRDEYSQAIENVTAGINIDKSSMKSGPVQKGVISFTPPCSRRQKPTRYGLCYLLPYTYKINGEDGDVKITFMHERNSDLQETLKNMFSLPLYVPNSGIIIKLLSGDDKTVQYYKCMPSSKRTFNKCVTERLNYFQKTKSGYYSIDITKVNGNIHEVNIIKCKYKKVETIDINLDPEIALDTLANALYRNDVTKVIRALNNDNVKRLIKNQ